MPGAIITVDGLGKRYRLGGRRAAYFTLRDAVAGTAGRLAGLLRGRGLGAPDEDLWALRDVSFEVRPGEVVGIIGRNGAGKSTLLKILSRITEPTEGRAVLRGRVGSLLEVGTGFHPELTGRENILLSGAILGMRRAEIARRFDEIVAFAGVEKFLDTPCKHYSSGMYVRLGFAVAAHLDPEILLVDEVLAVGDAEFQKKCLGKMSEVARGGRTILFVSHNMASMRALCQRGLLLDRGRVVQAGTIDEAAETYLRGDARPATCAWKAEAPVSGEGGKATLLEVRIADDGGETASSVLVDRPFSICMAYNLMTPVPFLRAGFEVCDLNGTVVLCSVDTDITDMHGKPRSPGVYRERGSLPGLLLMPGTYSVNVFVGIPRRERLVERNDVVRFEVVENNTHLSHVTGGKRSGYLACPLPWSIDHEPAG